MGFGTSVSYFDRGRRETFGDRVGMYGRYRYQQFAYRLERVLLSDRCLYGYRVWRNQLGVSAAADPRELRYVDPAKIRKPTAFHPHFCWRKIGAVKGGNWDRGRPELKDQFPDVWAALVARFERGADWADTRVVQETLDGDRH